MTFPLSIRHQPSKENKEKGIILLTSVIVLAGIILILMSGSYLSINTIRWQAFSLPKSAQSLANAESCLAIALAKLRINPAYNTQGTWETFQKGNIHCQYLITNSNETKIIKTKGFYSNYFKKIIIELNI